VNSMSAMNGHEIAGNSGHRHSIWILSPVNSCKTKPKFWCSVLVCRNKLELHRAEECSNDRSMKSIPRVHRFLFDLISPSITKEMSHSCLLLLAKMPDSFWFQLQDPALSPVQPIPFQNCA
jgi:hypothetical protein